jgi:hypothetical protein
VCAGGAISKEDDVLPCPADRNGRHWTRMELITILLKYRCKLAWQMWRKEGPSSAAGGGLVDRLPVRGAFIEAQYVCTSVPTLSWGQYRNTNTNTNTVRKYTCDPHKLLPVAQRI